MENGKSLERLLERLFIKNLQTNKEKCRMKKEHIPILITPDTIRDGIEEKIILDITENYGLKFLWGKYQRLSTKDVETIYPKLVKKRYFSYVKQNLTMGVSKIVLLEGEDPYRSLKRAKGKFIRLKDRVEFTGLRLKYRSQTPEEINKYSVSEDMFWRKMCEYRLHVPEDLLESLTLCGLFVDNNDLKTISMISPNIYEFISRLKR